MDINSLINEMLKSIKSSVDGSELIGKPIINGDGNIILPVSKVSVGFVCGNATVKKKGKEDNDMDIPSGISGGGVTITPLGFLVCGREKRFVSVDKSDNKWANLIDDVVTIIKQEK